MSLLNRAKTRREILNLCAKYRPSWECVRVSEEALTKAEAEFRNVLRRMVETHPTIGKTFKP